MMCVLLFMGLLTAAALWGPFARADLEAHQPDHWLDRPEQILELSEPWGRVSPEPAPAPSGS